MPFLQLVALAEGYMLDSDELAGLYETTATLQSPLSERRRPPAGPVHPAAELIPLDRQGGIDGHGSPAIAYDLRAALNQLQFACQHAVGWLRSSSGRLAQDGAEQWTASEGQRVWELTSLHGCARAELNDDEDQDFPPDLHSTPSGPQEMLKQLRHLRTAAEARSFGDAHLLRTFRRESDVSRRKCAAVRPALRAMPSRSTALTS